MSAESVSEPRASTEILQLFPLQGRWHERDYFALPGNRMVELVRGHVEVLPVPSLLHQFLSQLIFLKLHDWVQRHDLGRVMAAPTRVRLGDRHYREPDVLYVANDHLDRRQEQYWEAIDLAVEIISPDDPDRDLVQKRREYAAAGIQEYWVVDPRDDSVSVYELRTDGYGEINPDARHREITSRVLTGLQVDVAELFRQARAQ